jgi:hypothetical protein
VASSPPPQADRSKTKAKNRIKSNLFIIVLLL